MYRSKNVRAKKPVKGLHCFKCRKHELRPYEKNGKIVDYRCSYCGYSITIEDLGYDFFTREWKKPEETNEIKFKFVVIK